MKNLVLKDMRLLGIFNVFLIGTPLGLAVIGANFEDINKSMTFYTMAILIPVYILVIRMSINDMQSNVNPLLISLPVKKFDIVKSRYISILIYVLIISVIVFLSSNMTKSLFSDGTGTTFNLTTMLFTTSIILLFLSVNIPFQYYDPRKTQLANALLYAFIILLPNLVRKFNLDIRANSIVKEILTLDFNLLALIFLVISLSMYTASLFVSKTIYSKKEF